MYCLLNAQHSKFEFSMVNVSVISFNFTVKLFIIKPLGRTLSVSVHRFFLYFKFLETEYVEYHNLNMFISPQRLKYQRIFIDNITKAFLIIRSVWFI